VEQLEPRRLLTLVLPGPVNPVPLPFPNPLVPGPGDTQILANVIKMSVSNRHVLDHLPVPYVIDVSATNPSTGAVVTTVVEGQAHTPIKIDADQSKSTGQGGSGFDIQVELDAFVDPAPHLVLTVDRLGNAPFATNLSIVLAFPFAGFDLEPGLPSTPNLVMGFQTRAAGNTVGGYAPLEEVMILTPGTLAGISHTFLATMATAGANNPLAFILGNLDGTNLTGTLNAAGLQAYVETVPSTISVSFATVESPLGAGPVYSSFALNWQASSASLVQMDYLEYVSNPATASGPDFNTSLMANQMPTNEQFSLTLNELAGTLTLSQQGNSTIGQMAFQKTRSDPLAIVGVASAVPTQVNLTLTLAGAVTLTDNADIGSLAVQASKSGGFANTSSFLGYNVATVGTAVANAASLSADFSASGNTYMFAAAPAASGNTIGGIELLASSDSPANVQLPTRWSNPAWDVFSMIDTGTGDTAMPPVFAPGATAAARLLNLLTGSWTLTTAPLSIAFDVTTTTATPLQSYLRTTPTSKLTPGHDDEATCELVNIPAGETKFFFDGPTNFGVTTLPPTSINDIHCFGHLDSLAFDIDVGGVPPVFSFKWDPDSILTILAQDGHGGNAFLGHLSSYLADSNGISLFPDAGTLFGTKLKEARLRVDNIPTFTGTWVVNDASGNTVINFNTVAPGLFAGGVQLAVSTMYNDPALANPFTPAASVTADYASFNDAGIGARNLAVGILGIDSFSYTVMNASEMVNIVWDDDRPVPFNLSIQSITGGVYLAGNQVMLSENVALVPTHLDYTATLDYTQTFIGTNAIPSIDLTFGQNVGLPQGTMLTVHADNLPPVTTFDFEPALGTYSILAQDLSFQNTQRFGDILLDLEDPSGLPGTSSLLGAPIEQARLRLDDVPSITATYATTGTGTTIGLMSDAPGLSIGGAQLQISTAIDLAPLGPPSGSDDDVVTLSDPGSGMTKHLIAELFGLTNVTYSTSNAGNTTSIVVAQDVARPLTATVVSDNGNFFPGHNVDASIAFNDLPASINFSSNFATQFSYTASSGINSITVGGSMSAQGTFDATNFSLLALGLPASVNFTLDPNNGATLAMSDAITQLMFSATSDSSTILGTGTYKLIEADLNNIPANWNASWSGGQFVVQATDAAHNPAAMGQVSATVSTSDDPMTNANNIMPFQISGPGGARINYSPYLQTIDDRYFGLASGGAPVTLAQIQNLYNNAQVLTNGEDHAVALVSGGSLNFLDAQFTGFQKIEYQPSSNGGHFEFDAPTPGPHPFLAGVGLDGSFLIGHIDNIPASATLDINLATHNVHFHSSASAGNIDVYYGPQGMAQDSDTALRAVLENTPTDVQINWDFGFPNGTASFVASNPFTLLLLAQDGSHRLVAGARLQELDVNYGMNILPLSTHISTTFGVPTNFTVVLFSANAGINVGSSGVPVDGFFNLYSMKSGPDALTPPGPAPGASEYIPDLTFMMRNFTSFSVNVLAGVSITILPIPGIIHPTLNVSVNLTGQFVFDVWQDSDINDTLFGAIGYVDPADYSDNTPIQFTIPLNIASINIQNHGGLTFSFEGFGAQGADSFDPLG